jgi:hypothetical protein
MVDQIGKIIPLITVAGGTAASSPQIKAQLEKILETTQTVAVQQEVNDIAKMVYLDVVGEHAPKPEEFAAYLKKNMRAANGGARDTSLDIWGTPYGLVYDTANHVVYVISAGPDKQYNTADDVYASYQY